MVNHSRIKAFTLIEILIVLGMFLGILVIVLPIGIRELQFNKAQNTAYDIESSIHLAQSNSFSGLDSSSYGVAIFNDHYIYFKGDSLSTAISQDEFRYNNGVSIKNNLLNPSTTEIVFQAGDLKANCEGSFDIGSDVDNYRLSINKIGLISLIKL